MDPGGESSTAYEPLAFPAVLRRRRMRIARWLGRAAFAGWLGPPILASLFTLLQEILHVWHSGWADDVLQQWGYSFLFGLVCAFASAMFAISYPLDSGDSSVTRVDSDGIVYTKNGKTRRIRRDLMTDAVVVPLNPTIVEIHLRGGDIVAMELSALDEGLARQIVSRLGFSANEQRVTIRLASPQRKLAIGCVALPFIFCFMIWVAMALSELLFLRGNLAGILCFLGTAALTYLVTRWRRPPEVVIGSDGVVVRGPFRTKYHPHSDIARVEAHDTRLMFFRRGPSGALKGEKVAKGDTPLVFAAAQRIQEASSVARGGGSSANIADLLGAGALSLDSLKARLASMAQNADYRRGTVTPEDLLRVMENPDEDRARRIGAAMALQKTEPYAVPRIRVAASACADDDLRVALESAAEDELSEETFQRATRKIR